MYIFNTYTLEFLRVRVPLNSGESSYITYFRHEIHYKMTYLHYTTLHLHLLHRDHLVLTLTNLYHKIQIYIYTLIPHSPHSIKGPDRHPRCSKLNQNLKGTYTTSTYAPHLTQLINPPEVCLNLPSYRPSKKFNKYSKITQNITYIIESSRVILDWGRHCTCSH